MKEKVCFRAYVRKILTEDYVITQLTPELQGGGRSKEILVLGECVQENFDYTKDFRKELPLHRSHL